MRLTMRLTSRHQLLGLVVLAAWIGCSLSAPLPVPDAKIDEKDNAIEAYEDGLLIFVPTVPVADKDKPGKELKREVEYELIAIPGDVLRREIRQIAQTYGAPPPSTIYNQPSVGVPLPSLPSKPSISLPALSKPTLSLGFSNKPDFGNVISSVAGQATGYVGNAGQTLANVGAAGTQVLGQVTSAAASGGAQLAGWALNQKARGISTATQVVGGGLQYAGQLSAGVLRALLQVPGIKARVLAEIIEAGQPLIYAISDVIANSAGDLGDVFEAKTSILQEALGLVIRLVQDTLALKGRIIVNLSSSGGDIAATAFNAGMRIGGAAIDTAANVATAVGSGVGDLVSAAKSVNLPPLPALPPLQIPQLPVIDVPKINIPNVDLSGLIPPKPVLPPLPQPVKPTVSITTITQAKPTITVSRPSQTYGR